MTLDTSCSMQYPASPCTQGKNMVLGGRGPLSIAMATALSRMFGTTLLQVAVGPGFCLVCVLRDRGGGMRANKSLCT